jgi:hypothetical protein
VILGRARVAELEQRLDAGDAAAWAEYRETAVALAALAERAHRSGDLLTTGQLAQQLGVSSKTVLRRRASGQLKPAAVLGQRGRAALRWRA